MGEIIDLEIDKFSEWLSGKNIGEIKQIIMMFETAYCEIVKRKNLIIGLENSIENVDLVRQMYSELFKIETKVEILRAKEKSLCI